MPETPAADDANAFHPMPLPGNVVAREAAEELTPVPFQFSDIRALAAKILKRAQEQAEQKLAAARSQIAALEKETQNKAYQEGMAKGEKAGFAKGEKEGRAAGEAAAKQALADEMDAFRRQNAPAAAALKEIVSAVQDSRQALMAQAEGDLLLLSLDLARRIVCRELALDPEAIRPVAGEAISLVADRSRMRVRVNPEDLEAMAGALPDFKTLFPDLGEVSVEGDPAVERGGIVVATREAEVDMKLATRFAAFEEAILGYSGREAAAPWSRAAPGGPGEARGP